MTGRHHLLVSGAAMTAAVALDGYAFKIAESTTGIYPQQLLVKHFFINYFYPDSVLLSGELIIFCWSAIIFAGYLFGSLLPDIDSKTSIIGRKIHLPFEHRTWTHSIWAIILLFILSIFFVLIRPILIGYIMHMLEDTPSACGICWLYPFHKYIEYESGAKVARGHKFKLYRTSDMSESIFVFGIIAIFVIIIWFCGISGQGFEYFWNVLISCRTY
jgi:membrane-bound metal-dependent hydrolase